MSHSIDHAATRPATRYRHNPRLAKQSLGGKAVVLHYEGRKLFGLNETGTRIWGLLDGTRTVDEISRALASSDGLDEQALLGEITAFLAELESRGLIVEAPAAVETEASARQRASEERQ